MIYKMRRNLFTGLMFLLIALSMPIIVNFIIGFSTPFDIKLIGTSSDWLLFFGSYFGGVFTALITFYVLISTITQTKKEAEIGRKRIEIERLESRLDQYIEKLNFSEIGNIVLNINDNLYYKIEKVRLDTFRDALNHQSNALHLIFGNKKEPYIKDFIQKYDECIKQLKVDITSMISKILEIQQNGLNAESLSNISNLVLELDKHKEEFAKPVYLAAQKWLETENDIYEKLIR